MLGYTTIGTNDFERAIEFFDALLEPLGAKKTLGREGLYLWGAGEGAMLGVCKPHDEKEATIGNGVMLALNAGSKEKVDQIYEKAISLGASDEGAPGLRGGGPFYGGYFRDLDGNKFAAFCIVRE